MNLTEEMNEDSKEELAKCGLAAQRVASNPAVPLPPEIHAILTKIAAALCIEKLNQKPASLQAFCLKKLSTEIFKQAKNGEAESTSTLLAKISFLTPRTKNDNASASAAATTNEATTEVQEENIHINIKPN